MRAVVYEKYGPPDVLRIQEIEKPEPGERDLLIQVKAVSLNRSDWECLIGKPFYARIGGLTRPNTTILGTDIAGVVEAVGAEVETFQPGDEVLGDIMYHGGRGFAEYVKVPDTAPLVLKPPTLDFVAASTLPQSGVIALQATRDRVSPSDRVLINGAGGGTGLLAIQLAKHAEAEVTGVDNRFKQEFMLDMGADHVIDYMGADYTRSGRYQLILDLVCERSMFAIRRAVAPGGRYSVVGGTTRGLMSAATVGRALSNQGRKMGVLMIRTGKQDLSRIVDLVTTGRLRTAVERTYSLEEVPEALAHMGEGRALGKLVIQVS